MNWFKNLKINTKLQIGFASLLLIFIGATIFSIIELNSLGNMQDKGATISKNTIRIHEILLDLEDIYSEIGNVIINRNISHAKTKVKELEKTAAENIKTLQTILNTNQEKKQLEKFDKIYTGYLSLFDKELIPLLERDTIDVSKGVKQIDIKINDIRENAFSILNGIADSLQSDNARGDELFDSKQATVSYVTVIVLLMGILLSIIITFFISRFIVRPVNKAKEMMTKMSVGNLQMRLNLDTKDEIGEMSRAMDMMANNLKGFVSLLNEVGT
jgi:methyl-accepting chemotaxis protein